MQQPENSSKNSNSIRQFSRFIVVGFSNFGVSFAVFYLFYNHWQLSAPFFTLLGGTGRSLEALLLRYGFNSLDATLANIVGYSAGVINSFTWNKLWTFKAKHETASQFSRFLALNLACLALSSASLFLFTDYFGLPYLPVWFITMAFVTLKNFLVSKYWVFRNGRVIK